MTRNKGFAMGGAKTVDVDFEKFVNLLAGSSVFQAAMPVGPRVERRGVVRAMAPIDMLARMA